jgi:hypothetical protein
MADDREEGWYTDPFGLHEARWMSAGRPTKLVRDGTVESYDAPPDEEPSAVPERIVPEPPPGTRLPHSGDGATEAETTQAGAAVFGALTSWELPPKNQ